MHILSVSLIYPERQVHPLKAKKCIKLGLTPNVLDHSQGFFRMTCSPISLTEISACTDLASMSGGHVKIGVLLLYLAI